MGIIGDKSRNYFSKKAIERKDKTTVSARYDFDSGKEKFVLDDILLKLAPGKGERFFDIGCGYGFLTDALITHLQGLENSITLMDIPEMIEAVESELDPGKRNNLTLIKGLFPQDFVASSGFDRILLYSVLHYTDDPLSTIEAAIGLLNPNGRLLLGDLPNISKKGRFLSSTFGRAFDAGYKNTTPDQLPVYQNHHEFVAQMKADPEYFSLIDDAFIQKVQEIYTQRGYEVYLLKQPDNLPMCYTREDILICRYD